MAEAIFQLSAEITPVINDRELQRQAEILSKRINSMMGKDIKPIQISASDKATQQIKENMKQTGNEVVKTTKQTALLQQGFKNAQATLEKTLARTKESGAETISVLSKISKTLQDIASKGFKQLGDVVKKLSPAVGKLGKSITSTMGRAYHSAVDGARKATIGLFDKLNITNTKMIQFNGNIRQAIRENRMFKRALVDVSNSSGVISSLGPRFQNIEAQVASGTSSLQKNAKAGDKMAQNLVPFLTIAIGVSKALAVMSENMRQVTVAQNVAMQKTTTFGERFRGFGSNAEGATRTAIVGFKNLFQAAGDNEAAVHRLQGTFDHFSARGAKGLVQGLKGLRPELKAIALEAARSGGEFVNYDKIIKRTLFNLDPNNLKLFDRISVKIDIFVEKLQRIGGKISDFGHTLGNAFTRAGEIAVNAIPNTLRFFDAIEAKIRGFADTAKSSGIGAAISQLTAPITRAFKSATNMKDPVQSQTAASQKQAIEAADLSDQAFKKATDAQQKAIEARAKAEALIAQATLTPSRQAGAAATAQAHIAKGLEKEAEKLIVKSEELTDKALVALQRAKIATERLEELQRKAATLTGAPAAVATASPMGALPAAPTPATPVYSGPSVLADALNAEAVKAGKEAGDILATTTATTAEAGLAAKSGGIWDSFIGGAKGKLDSASGFFKNRWKKTGDDAAEGLSEGLKAAKIDTKPIVDTFKKTGADISGKFIEDIETTVKGKRFDPKLNDGPIKATGKRLGSKFQESFQESASKSGKVGKDGLAGSMLGNADTLFKPFKAFGGIIGGATGGMEGLGLGAFGARAGIVAIGAAALASAAKFETFRVALQGILGESKGIVALDKIADFAAVTPFRLETATEAVIKLASSFDGLQAEGAIAILQQVAGAAAAVGASDDAINRVVLAMTQIQAVGKVTADNLRQITEALPSVSKVGIIKALATDLGVTKEVARTMLNDGLVPAQRGLDALIVAMHNVPGANEALEKQSKTFTGLISTTKDLSTQFLAELGKPILALVVPVIVLLNVVLKTLTETIKAVVNVFMMMEAPMQAATLAVFGLAAGFIFLRGAMAVLAGQVALVFAAFAIGFSVVTLLISLFNGFEDTLARMSNGLNKITGGFLGSSDAADEAGDAYETSGQKLEKARRAIDPVLRSLDQLLAADQDIASITAAMDEFTEASKDAAIQFQQGLVGILEKTLGLKSAFDGATRAAEAVTAAQVAYTDAIAKHNEEVAAKAIELNKDLAEATEDVTEASLKAADAQTALDKALLGAAPEDVERADMALAGAKLRLRQIIEDEKNALNELNEVQSTGIDLAGLSLDQVKSRLRTVRASLALQKQGAKQDKDKDKKTPEELAIDKGEAVITKRSAELDIVDAVKAAQLIRDQGTEKDPEVIAARKAVVEADKDSAVALGKQAEIQAEINDLAKINKDWEKEKSDLQKNITEAKEAQRDADIASELAVAKSTNNYAEIVRLLGVQITDNPKLKQALIETNVPAEYRLELERLLGIEIRGNRAAIENNVSALDAMNAEFDKLINAATTTPEMRDILRLQQFLGNSTVNKGQFRKNPIVSEIVDRLTGPGTDDPEVIRGEIEKFREKIREFAPGLTDEGYLGLENQAKNTSTIAVALATAQDEDRDLNDKEVRDVIEKALKTLPGLSDFKLAQGAVIDKATSAIVGEAGREVVLPLTRPGRLMDLLSNRHVLPPVLNALQRMNLSGAVIPGRAPNPLSPLPHGDLETTRRIRSSAQNPNAQEQTKRDRAFARAIVAEMKEAGFTGGGETIVNNDFTAPNPNDPLAAVQLRQIAREVKKQIEKGLR